MVHFLGNKLPSKKEKNTIIMHPSIAVRFAITLSYLRRRETKN